VQQRGLHWLPTSVKALLCLIISCVSLPAVASTVFIYSSQNQVHGVNLTTGQQALLTTASLSPTVNALGFNSEKGLVYYGDGTSIYYWDPSLGSGANSHAAINNFENGAFQEQLQNIDSAGGSFLNGKYYIGSETDNGFIEELYELTMSTDGRQLVSVTALGLHAACNCSEVQIGGFGDIAALEEGGSPVIYGSSADITNDNQGTHTGIWRFDLGNGSWTLLNDNGQGGQLSGGLDGRLYTNIGRSIREVNI